MNTAFDSPERAREMLVEAGRAMRSARLVVAREGNLSVRIADDRALLTPAGVDKGTMDAADMVIVDLDGNVQGPGQASMETPMHLEIYRRRPDVRAVAHGHPVYATAFAVAGRALDACLLPEVITALGCIPLAPYGTPSTDELSGSVGALCEDHDAFLLQNHGAVAVGDDPLSAVEHLETVERLAEITWLAEAIGGARPLTRDQVDRLMEMRSAYGSTRSLPDCRSSDD